MTGAATPRHCRGVLRPHAFPSLAHASGPAAPEPVFLPVQARYAGGAGPGTREGEHAITANNRWSRVQLTFRHLPAEAWCCLEATLAWTDAEEGGQALDFLLAGFDFLAADGSSLDVEQVPGLVRTLLDPHSAWIAGPACQPAGSELMRAAPVRVAFGVPPPQAAASPSRSAPGATPKR